ncbi:MAG: hypothetical protein H6P96_78, partial [Candidatus Aminicenantes bacterium]|nr:hypothetical protein [Candidatus Aminicenantes bacterium]
MKRKEFLKMTAGLAGGIAGLPVMGRFSGAATRVPAATGPAATAPITSAPVADLLAQAAAAGDDEFYWKLIRDQFILDPEWTFLNFGGLGSCPLPVLDALVAFTRAEERAPSAGHDE